MKPLFWIFLLCLFTSCRKTNEQTRTGSCNMTAIKTANSAKVTISNGIWRTVSLRQGNCMPTTGINTSCSECPIKKEVRVYTYTTYQDVGGTIGSAFFSSIKTQLLKSVISDDEGFFQAQIPDGKYSIFIVEDGKIYASLSDGQGGISSVTVKQSKVNFNLVLDKAVY